MSSTVMAQVCAILEEELGESRPLANLPASEIEAIAARLARALEPVLEPALEPAAAERRTAA